MPGLAGCQFGRPAASVQVQAPILVRGNNLEQVWEQTIDVLHDYNFEIARENKQDGVIESKYKIGAGLAEPWHKDSVGFTSRLESSMQSIRRRVFISITPTEDGFLVTVEVFKELENLVGLAANSAGGATFQESAPLQRDLNVVVGQTAPSGWIAQGHDTLLEQDISAKLVSAFGR
ncbi:MAG: hypothetical protein IID45_06200 [Planctomycetes bacterium]|nr:hypothetical protein [Planctomycetota bacterium]